MEAEIGMLARSKAGHDKGQVFVIEEIKDDYVYLVDGKNRTLTHPKKKKKKHVQLIGEEVEIQSVDDGEIKSILKTWRKEKDVKG